MKDIILILHNIRSRENVGSLFRSADAFGVSKIILVGYSPRPVINGIPDSRVSKTALGAEGWIPWEESASLKRTTDRLKKEGYTVLALEIPGDATYQALPKAEKVAVILGNEVDGLSKRERSMADITTFIPMYGKKESLNVAVAGGIILAELRR
jgi:23S rRNA (guanosine2251-2'-O)-methyltransferase